jgi:hypothetical protein
MAMPTVAIKGETDLPILWTPAAQREQQFLRLRDRIEARAARKFSDVELEGNPPGVILRAIDFRAP